MSSNIKRYPALRNHDNAIAFQQPLDAGFPIARSLEGKNALIPQLQGFAILYFVLIPAVSVNSLNSLLFCYSYSVLTLNLLI
ncbi:MAG: hypothetical protein SAJ11_21395, partial [Jaaginema sp. PMC 1078.18]|nr:hypothetical protein [Jaaginema sp. PMC 1078.18]